MAAVSFLWFFSMLILSMGLVTVVEANWPDSFVGRTFGVLF